VNKLRFALLVVLALASLQIGSLSLLRTPSAAALTNCTVNDLSIDGEEQSFLDTQINPYRLSVGLTKLTMAVELNRAASWMAIDLATHASFSHTDSLGRDPFTRMTQCDAPPGNQAENIAGGYDTAASVFAGWKNSPGHDANMRGAYNYIGIARACCGSYGWYWVTTFSTTGTPLGGGGGGLPAPTITSVTPADSTTLNVSFNDAASTETGFDYERKTGTGGTYQVVFQGGALAGTQAGWYWPNTGLAPATQYCYRLRARNGTTFSAYSNEVCGTTQAGGGLLAPSNVSISVADATTLNVTFNDNATTETGFDYERKTGTGGTYQVVFQGGALAGTQAGWYWPNSGLAPGTTYCYRIRAKNGGTFSPYSNEGCGTTPGGTGLPAPSAVSVSPGGAGTLNVLFNDNATTETSYEYQRRVGQNGNWAVVLNGNSLPGAQAGWYWTNSGLTSGTQYCYRLRAVQNGTFSAFSNIACNTAP
jgi:uncharacterized protein YkwD